MTKIKQSLTTLAFIKYYDEKQYQSISDITSNKYINAIREYCSKDKFHELIHPISQTPLLDLSFSGTYTDMRFNINNHTLCSLTDLSILENRKRLLGDKWHFHNVYLDGDCLDYIDVHYDKLIQLKIYKEIMR